MQLGGDLNLYSPNRLGLKPRVKTGFKNADTARMTLKNIAQFPKTYQKQVVITMYNRARYHPHQTKDMKSGMRVFKSWMDRNDIKVSSKSRKKIGTTIGTRRTKKCQRDKGIKG